MTSRYDTGGTAEGECQPGSDGRVLLNMLGIADPEEMDNREFDLLADLEDVLFGEIEMDQRLTATDLREWHGRWLGSVYAWAGKYRNVNLAKGDFMFAAAHLVPSLMTAFERKFLAKYTPCNGTDASALTESLAVCHVELILIHPFREGNGRLARLLATVMALQADLPPLDFGIMEEEKTRYIAAIHAGLDNDYAPMKSIFSEVLKRSLMRASPSGPRNSG